MCELLGVVSNVPADLAFSFTGFALRGGQTGPHADGWGLSLYNGLFARTFLEPDPAFSSPLARFLRENPIPTPLAVAHIRKKHAGSFNPDTHPFVRVTYGRHIVFAHNGTRRTPQPSAAHPEHVGDTDSEHAFCVVLDTFRASYGDTPTTT